MIIGFSMAKMTIQTAHQQKVQNPPSVMVKECISAHSMGGLYIICVHVLHSIVCVLDLPACIPDLFTILNYLKLTLVFLSEEITTFLEMEFVYAKC